jgi:hypothetical protein
MSDEQMENEIIDLNLTAPRIPLRDVRALLERVTYRTERPEGTTSTFVHAFFDGKFWLGTGHTACVSPENFNAELGVKHATQNAEKIATDKLYELEGWRLFCDLNGV